MIELDKKELLDVSGGGTISASLLSALVRGAEISFEVGQAIGSSLRRLFSSKYCEIR